MAEKLMAKLYGGDVNILFTKGGHTYYVQETGERIKLSVSGVIGILDKIALKFWSANLCGEHIFDNWNVKKVYTEAEKLIITKEGSKKHSVFLRKQANSGTEVHDFAEKFANGENPLLPKEDKARNGVVAFQKWWSGADIKVVQTERIVYSKKYNVVGTCDVDAKINGKPCVIDYKTSSVYKKAKFYERDDFPDGFVRDASGELVMYPVFNEAKLQVAAYRGFLQEETGKKYGDSYVVRFDKEFGDFYVEILPAEEQDAFYKAFCQLIPIKKFLVKYEVNPFNKK